LCAAHIIDTVEIGSGSQL